MDLWRYIDGVAPVLRRRAFVACSLVLIPVLSCATGVHAQQGLRSLARVAARFQRVGKAMIETLYTLLRWSFTTTCVFRIILIALLGLTSIVADRSNAEQPRTSFCVEKLQRFVVSIDELLAKKVLQHEPFWAVIREYLPPKGCTVEEVISISQTSKFFAPPFEEYAAYTIIFRNADTQVTFGLQKDTGNIEYPNIGSTRLPSW